MGFVPGAVRRKLDAMKGSLGGRLLEEEEVRKLEEEGYGGGGGGGGNSKFGQRDGILGKESAEKGQSLEEQERAFESEIKKVGVGIEVEEVTDEDL